jgi:alcohol dehydrogenase class IV
MPRDLGLFEARFNTRTRGRFFFPQRLIWGEDNLSDICSIAESPVEIFVDRSIQKNKFAEELVGALQRQFDCSLQIVGRPYFEEIEEYVRVNPKIPVSIIAIGGGSTFDFAKGTISLRCFEQLDGLGVGENAGKQIPVQRFPNLICLPTTCGSGAESSRYVVTYSKTHGQKVHGKSWGLVADWVFIEPQLLSDIPLEVIVASAFDAFVHFFETLSMKHETTSISKMISTHGMVSIITSLDELISEGEVPSELLRELMICGSLGGVAISNTRTGHIHEAAGALVEHLDLPHGVALWIFFQSFARNILNSLPERFIPVTEVLRNSPTSCAIESFDEIFAWWQGVFAQTGLLNDLRETAKRSDLELTALVNSTMDRVLSDAVWLKKECPFEVNIKNLETEIESAITLFLGISR